MDPDPQRGHLAKVWVSTEKLDPKVVAEEQAEDPGQKSSDPQPLILF